MTVLDLAKQIVPGFPTDREIRGTQDRQKWYRWQFSTRTLYTPGCNVLRVNPLELDNFIEAVQAFAIADLSASTYDWENLHLYDFHGATLVQGFKLLNKVLDNAEYVACDIETRRVEWEDNKLLSIGFATDDSTCYAFYDIPITGASGDGHSSEVYDILEATLQRRDVKFTWHNGKFDCGRLKYLCNLDAHIDEDTMLLHYVRINETKGTHGLKALGQLYLQAPAWDDELDKLKREWCKQHKIKLKDFMYDYIPTSILIPYMQRDCIATYRLRSCLEALASPRTYDVYRRLVRASEVYMHVELAGMQLDMPYLEDLEWELEKDIKHAQERLSNVSAQIWNPIQYAKDTGAKSFSTEAFNVKSPKQLKWMLKQVLGYEPPSTDAATLQELMHEIELGRIKNPLARDFIESISTLRQCNKYMDTYVQGLREGVCRDGRIRGTYNLHGTETGRLSSSKPNMQNMPRNKKIKNLLRSGPGYKLLQLDYSQAELRVLAYSSGDPYMIDAYRHDKDFHSAVAEEMFGPEFTKEQRNMAKTINFGIAYGRGPSSIAEAFGKSMAESKEIIEKWYRPMPKVKEYIQGRRLAADRSDPCITVFGRERHFVLTDDNRHHVQNEYINTPIQSIASDLTMISLLTIADWIEKNHIHARVVATVHDSIILEVEADDRLIDTVAKKCLNIMATVPTQYLPNCTVPFKADAEVGDSYGGLEEWKPLK